jgi:hypothetical protein
MKGIVTWNEKEAMMRIPGFVDFVTGNHVIGSPGTSLCWHVGMSLLSKEQAASMKS